MNNELTQCERVVLERAVRVGDQLCSGYAHLRDSYRRRAFWLDLLILLLSAWLVSMAFVQPRIAVALSPGPIPSDIWMGLLSIAAFALSLVQLQVDWKGRAQLYQQAVAALSAFVKDHRHSVSSLTESQVGAALARYSSMTDGLEPIPENKFLALKKKHQLKVQLSRHLDTHPATNFLLWRIRIALRDNGIWRNRQVARDGNNQ